MSWWWILAAVVLIVVAAWCSGTEAALGRVSRVQVEEMQRRGLRGDVDARLRHRLDGGGIDPLGGLATRRTHHNGLARERAQEPGGHL